MDTISPKSNRKERLCSGGFLRQARRPPLHLPFASLKERRKLRRPDPPPSTRLDNKNRKVKTNFGGGAMQECRKWAGTLRADKEFFSSIIKDRQTEIGSVLFALTLTHQVGTGEFVLANGNARCSCS